MSEPQTPAQVVYEAWVRSKEHPPMPDKTPGHIAYDAYMTVVGNPWYVPAFHRRCAVEQAAWEAAAQSLPWTRSRAVREDTPRWQFTLGQHVRRDGDPAQRWEIWYRACREELDRTWIDYGLRLVDPEATYHPCRMSDGSDLTLAEDEP